MYISEVLAEESWKPLVKLNLCLRAGLTVLFKLWAQGIAEPPDNVSELIQQIMRHIGQKMAPAIHHLAKDKAVPIWNHVIYHKHAWPD